MYNVYPSQCRVGSPAIKVICSYCMHDTQLQLLSCHTNSLMNSIADEDMARSLQAQFDQEVASQTSLQGDLADVGDATIAEQLSSTSSMILLQGYPFELDALTPAPMQQQH